jgi:hypothetical protein
MRQESPGRPLAALGNVKQARLAIGMGDGVEHVFHRGGAFLNARLGVEATTAELRLREDQGPRHAVVLDHIDKRAMNTQ